MQKMTKRAGKLKTASFIVMGVGLVIFLSTPIWLQFGIDTDILGFLVFLIGLLIYNIYNLELIHSKNLGRLQLLARIALVSVLSLVILMFVVGLIFPDFGI